MSLHRKTDLDRVARSEVRFGYAVTLRSMTAKMSSKDRKRFIRHVWGSSAYRLTIVNTTWYIESRSARQQHAKPTPKQLHALAITKDNLRDVYGATSI